MHPFLENGKSAVDGIFLTRFGNVFVIKRSCVLGHLPHFEDNSLAVREGCPWGLCVSVSGRTESDRAQSYPRLQPPASGTSQAVTVSEAGTSPGSTWSKLATLRAVLF